MGLIRSVANSPTPYLNVDSWATKRKHLKGQRSLMIGSGNPTGGITTGVGLNI